MNDEHLRCQLLDMAAEDARVREHLLAAGTLGEGYHPEMEAVHVRHGERLGRIMDECGWPTPDRVGEDGARAAWLVAQHAISLPRVQRQALALIEAAATVGGADPRHAVLLADRIAFNEDRPQALGTVLDWDDRGEITMPAVTDPDTVDDRRRALGLAPLATAVAEARADAAREGLEPPSDPAAKRHARAAWARRTGWRP